MFLLLFWWQAGVAFVLLMLAALVCGLTGSAQDFRIPFWTILLGCAAASWLTAVARELVVKYRIPLSSRLSNAWNEGKANLVYIFPGLVILCAPAYFILTGALWTPVIAVIAATAVTLRTEFPIL